MAVATSMGRFRAIFARSQAEDEIASLIKKTVTRLIGMKATLSLPMKARQLRPLPSHISPRFTPNTPKYPHNEPIASNGGKTFDADWRN